MAVDKTGHDDLSPQVNVSICELQGLVTVISVEDVNDGTAFTIDLD